MLWERTFRCFCLPNADGGYDTSRTEPDNDARDNELGELERGRHEDAANRLHKAGYPNCLTPTKPVAHAMRGRQKVSKSRARMTRARIGSRGLTKCSNYSLNIYIQSASERAKDTKKGVGSDDSACKWSATLIP